MTLDLANPECDVNEILTEFTKSIESNRFINPTINRYIFITNDLYWWLKRQRNTNFIPDEVEYVNTLLKIWLAAGLIYALAAEHNTNKYCITYTPLTQGEKHAL